MKNRNKTFIIILGSIFAAAVISGILYTYYVYAPTPTVPSLTASSHQQFIQVKGIRRSYLSYVPKNIKSGSALIIILHGTNIDGKKIREWTGYEFDQLADQKGFAVVYPDGYGKDWNDCRKGTFSETKKDNIDDIAFIKKIISHFQEKLGIDSKRVYLFGYSSGGIMAFRMGIQEPRLIAGIATISASLPTKETSNCSITEKMPPVMMVNGTGDSICPTDGGPLNLFGRKIGFVMSAQSAIKTFASSNFIYEEPSVTSLKHIDPQDPTRTSRYDWSANKQVKFRLFVVQSGGHVIPQPIAKLPRILGRLTGDLNAPAEAVSFFGL